MRPESPSAAAGLGDWLRWQERLHPQAIALGLDRVREVAGRLELPAAGIQTFTVGGTNGKGSTAAILSSICRSAGHLTGAYTSPHLLRYNERICVDGAPVPDTELCLAFARVEKARGDTPLTYFEYGTLAALHLFREAGVRVQVLEVGLGGRLDAVNLVDSDCAIVTSIGLDHGEFLGDTLDQVAYEKAGIMRAGRPVVLSDPNLPAKLAEEANRHRAEPCRLGTNYHYDRAGEFWNWRGRHWRLGKLPAPALPGAMQYANAAGAIAALECLRDLVPVDEGAIRAGLEAVRLRGRFERRGSTLLDVAHNVDAARVLSANLRQAGIQQYRLVLGMLSDKCVQDFVAALPPALKIYAAALPGPRGLDARTLVERLPESTVPTHPYESPTVAWNAARAQADEGDTILVTGSFLTVAEILATLP